MSLRRAFRVLPCFMLATAACLEALPEATECREPEQVIAGEQCLDCPIEPEVKWTNSCITESVSGGQLLLPGTLGQNDEWERFGCLLGEANAESCTCASEPAPGPTCFSTSCPPLVQSVGEGAQCIRSDLQPSIQPATFRNIVRPGATCGCASAVLECDGKGLAFGGLTDEKAYVDLGSVSLLLPKEQLPSAGRMGVYVRMRGFAVPTVVLIGGKDVTQQTGFAFYSISDFEETIGFGPTDGGFPLTTIESEPFVWSRPEDKPEVVVIAPLPLQGGNSFHLSEIDCVIPFFIPDPGPW